jgi:hypothetical protein
MSEEQENGGFFSNLKNQIIAGAGVALTTIGTVFVDEAKALLGIADEEEAQTEQVEVKAEQNQSVNVTGPEIIINIPEQKTETKTIIKEVPAKPAPPKKTKEEKETEARKDAGYDW